MSTPLQPYSAMPCSSKAAEAVYMPRQASESILYAVVAENLETFLARQEQRERTVPKLWSGNSGRFLSAEFLRAVFFAFIAMNAGGTALFRFHAKAAVFANHAAHEEWRIRPRIL